MKRKKIAFTFWLWRRSITDIQDLITNWTDLLSDVHPFHYSYPKTSRPDIHYVRNLHLTSVVLCGLFYVNQNSNSFLSACHTFVHSFFVSFCLIIPKLKTGHSTFLRTDLSFCKVLIVSHLLSSRNYKWMYMNLQIIWSSPHLITSN